MKTVTSIDNDTKKDEKEIAKAKLLKRVSEIYNDDKTFVYNINCD